jgi:predicted amidohydrolase YtcJ
MKRTIDGMSYDTDTATYVCSLPCSFPREDTSYQRTALYRTTDGKLFLAGSGGARTIWAESSGQTTTGGEGILVVDEYEAREHMEAAGCTVADFIAAGFKSIY